MKKLLLTACAALLLSSAAVFAEGSGAPACRPGFSFAEAQGGVKTMADAKRADHVVVLDTVEAVDGFLKAYNSEYNKTVPLGQADHLIAFVLLEGDNAGLWIFGYKDGCQIGMTHISKAKMSPEAKLEVPRAFLDHGSWMLVI